MAHNGELQRMLCTLSFRWSKNMQQETMVVILLLNDDNNNKTSKETHHISDLVDFHMH